MIAEGMLTLGWMVSCVRRHGSCALVDCDLPRAQSFLPPVGGPTRGDSPADIPDASRMILPFLALRSKTRCTTRVSEGKAWERELGDVRLSSGFCTRCLGAKASCLLALASVVSPPEGLLSVGPFGRCTDTLMVVGPDIHVYSRRGFLVGPAVFSPRLC